MSKCGCENMSGFGLFFVKEEKPVPPPTHNDHVRAEGFAVTSPKVMPQDTKMMGTNTLRESGDA
jgi:hypothetical protein